MPTKPTKPNTSIAPVEGSGTIVIVLMKPESPLAKVAALVPMEKD